MAFTAKILSWRFRHLNIVGCLLKKKPTKRGPRHPRTPPPSPSYAPGLIAREQALHLGDIMNGRRARGTRVPASPLARSRVLALLAQIGQLARRLNVFQVLVLASFLPEPGQKHLLSF